MIISHPRIAERAFVLIALVDLDKSLVIYGKSIIELIRELGKDGVEGYKKLYDIR